jgi:hypothetical protein
MGIERSKYKWKNCHCKRHVFSENNKKAKMSLQEAYSERTGKIFIGYKNKSVKIIIVTKPNIQKHKF